MANRNRACARMQTRVSDASDGVKRGGNTSTQLDKFPKGETRRAGRADPEKAEVAELTTLNFTRSEKGAAGLVKRTPGQQKKRRAPGQSWAATPLRTTKKMIS
jgi:hypothetical protein